MHDRQDDDVIRMSFVIDDVWEAVNRSGSHRPTDLGVEVRAVLNAIEALLIFVEKVIAQVGLLLVVVGADRIHFECDLRTKPKR